jgi:hypothetical protein
MMCGKPLLPIRGMAVACGGGASSQPDLGRKPDPSIEQLSYGLLVSGVTGVMKRRSSLLVWWRVGEPRE